MRSGRVRLTAVLFAVYLALLVGLVLLKFPFVVETTGGGRELNLIPLAGSFSPSGVFEWREVVENVGVFVPFGIYLAALRPRWPLATKLLVPALVSVVFEAAQYAFAIGRADITDVIGNTLGGAIGVCAQVIVRRMAGERCDRAFRVIALVLTIAVLVFCAFLTLHGSVRARPSGG